jgi:uncharacterized protein (UPF0333 family)
MAKKKKKPQSELQYRFSLVLVLTMMCLVGGFFLQSFLQVREEKPVRVALERLGDR